MTAAGTTPGEVGTAPLATNAGTGRLQNAERSTGRPSEPTRSATQRSEGGGSVSRGKEQGGTTPTSQTSGAPSEGSSRRWRKPRDAKAFAVQANEVATMILNGEIDLDKARAYSGVARTMAQVLSAEVYRARFLHQEPNLTLEDESDD